MSETETKIRIWIAAYTAPNLELAVRDAVQAQGYPALVPAVLAEIVALQFEGRRA